MEPVRPLWEDRQIKFDVANLQNNLRGGEKVLTSTLYIEDTKGNPGDTGKLLATNLRLIWYSLVHKKFNLSIGYSRIITMTTKSVFAKNRGATQALYVLAAGTTMRFEFLFGDVASESNRSKSLFGNYFDLYRLYQKTMLYRELKLRGAIVQFGHLIVLPQEQVFSNLNGVWNLSSDQGNLGSFIVTNIRLVWFADVNEGFNLSLPYIQIGFIKIRDSKYGPALVIQTLDTAGSYVLGFRIDPPERLNDMFKELTSLFAIYRETPNFGINYDPVEQMSTNHISNDMDHQCVDEFIEMDEQHEREINSKLNSYLAEGSSSSTAANPPREPFYCKELGFAMEKLRDGYKLSDLWDVIPAATDLMGNDDEQQLQVVSISDDDTIAVVNNEREIV